MNNLVFLVFFLMLVKHAVAQTNVSNILKQLDRELEVCDTYIKTKEQRIKYLKAHYAMGDEGILEDYKLNKAIYEEFRTFQIDSAIKYVVSNSKIAERLGVDLANECRLQLANLYSISGRYIEADKLLEVMGESTLPNWVISGYYEGKKNLYTAYASHHHSSSVYRELSKVYRDSLLSTLDTQSNQYKTVLAEKLRVEGSIPQAKDILFSILKNIEVNTHEYAIVTSAIGSLFKEEGNLSMQKQYFALSAIADIKNAIRENTSLQSLAIALFETGDIDRSYKFSKHSMEDAIFCNAPLRTLEISRLHPIIDSAYQDKSQTQKRQLITSLTLISLLSIGLVIAIVFVIMQVKKLATRKRELHHVNSLLKNLNETLQSVNSELITVNKKLTEANRIKEEYIGNFLDLCSSYINKLEDYRKILNKKATSGKIDELFKLLKSSSMVEHELRLLFQNFDNIFIHLYPDFVEEFNKLLVEEERFVLKPHEILNTELRIFALVRLGIQDSSRIASFLRYSASTVYNYRTKVRNKAGVPRESFELLVMNIGNIV